MELEADDFDMSSGSDLSSLEGNEEEIRPPKKKIVRFSEAQRACLNSYFSAGMNSTASEHAPIIKNAAQDTHLSAIQVKVQLTPLDVIAAK